MRRFLMMSTVMFLAACSPTTIEPHNPPPALTGSWVGKTDTAQPISLTVVERNGTVTGNGALNGVPFSIGGTFVRPNFTGVLRLDTGTLVAVNASLTGDTYQGVFFAGVLTGYAGAGGFAARNP